MKGEIDHITSKIETLEMNQETAHNVRTDIIRKNILRIIYQENMSTHTRLDEMAVKVKEIRQLTGVRYLWMPCLFIILKCNHGSVLRFRRKET